MSILPEALRCFLVEKGPLGLTAELRERPLSALPSGEVLIRVAWSSLNYKDALAATGHAGVNKVFPHVPGVDAAGTVVQSGVYEYVPGDPVLVTGFDMGSNRWGGWAEYVRVPAEWIVPLPPSLTLREAMIFGTAGFTAGLCVDALERHDVSPDRGEVVVTGASGGVGSMAVAILAKLGYAVVAVTGKPHARDFLKALGAKEVVPREAVDDRSDKPLLSSRWAGGVDTVGGNMLATVLRATRHDGCVAACGLTAGNQLSLTVYPFILRAVTLTGIDAAFCPLPIRHETWKRLADPWKPESLEQFAETVDLAGLPPKIEQILAGEVRGRVVVRVADELPVGLPET